MATRKRPRAKRGASKSRRATTRKSAARKPAARRRVAPKKPRPAAKRAAPARAAKAPAWPASAIGMRIQHVDYTSQSMDEVKRFYTELLGFKRFDHHDSPQMNYLSIMTGPSSSLGFMPPMEGAPDQWRPPREPALYFMVKDVDAAHRELSGRGVTFDGPPQDMPWGHRVVHLKDPEGRRVSLAQQLMK